MCDEKDLTKDGSVVELIHHSPKLAAVAAELLWWANHSDDTAAFLDAALPIVAKTAAAQYVAVAIAESGTWRVLGDVGSPQSLPVDLLSEVLDRETVHGHGVWLASPLDVRSAAAEVLVVRCSTAAGRDEATSAVGSLSPVCRDALAAVGRRYRQQHRQQRRVGRLEAILEIANRWNLSQEVEPLLTEMAEAATRLLGADRASIFLWHRPSHTLVGRPALGVEAGELRIPDDAGVVGQVVQTGRPRRVDASVDRNQINRHVDTQLGYETKTVLCVPLRGSSGELFGAFEVMNKLQGTFTSEDEAGLVELAAHAAVALENTQDRQRLSSINRQITEQAAEGVQLIGQSPAIEALRSIVQRVADTDLAVLILGENGTGKEVVAQSIHYLSSRRAKPFVAVNCAAIPDALAESELFGHEKGAFTDAQQARLGKFELAADGTLFLDEIGDLSLGGQAKLLRVLEEKVLVRVGGSVPIQTDARVVAATNQNLAEMVSQKRFRPDLFFRLNVVTMELPPLRDRVEDIIALSKHFLDAFCTKARRKVLKFSAAARKRLEAHDWPGNVRELRNLMERLAYLSTTDCIEASDLAFILSPQGQAPLAVDLDQSLADATANFQIDFMKRAIEQAGGNMSQAAGRMGLHRSNLYRKMRQLGMTVPT